MKLAERLVLFALAFNIIVLVPVVGALLSELPQAEQSVGPVTDARLILTSIYIAIAIVSAGLIAMHMRRLAWAVPMSVFNHPTLRCYTYLTGAEQFSVMRKKQSAQT